MHESGVGDVLVFFALWYGVDLNPHRYGSRYYDEFPKFIEHVEGLGTRPWTVGFCDQDPSMAARPPESWILTPAEADFHHAFMGQMLQGRLYSFGNEVYQNGVDLIRRLPPLPGVLCDRGQWADGEDPRSVGGKLNFGQKSYARKQDWSRTAKDAAEAQRLGLGDLPAEGIPYIGREPPCGIYEATIPWSRSDDPQKFSDWHALADGAGAGSILHGDPTNLQYCIRPGPRAQACVDAVRQIWQPGLIPVDAAGSWQYTRGGLGDCPLKHSDRYADDNTTEVDRGGCLRTFVWMGGGEAIGFAIDPGSDWRPEGDHGWSVVEQRGPYGRQIYLRR